MGVSALRVINDDHVEPGGGFATHSHQDMEIISYVKEGLIEHKDNLGNVQTLPAGEFQLMSAGTGITHSEYNPSHTAALKFLQIWIEPNQFGIDPGYQQRRFTKQSGIQAVITPDGGGDTLRIHQNASVYQALLEPRQQTRLTLNRGRTAYMHVVSGDIVIDSEHLREGDGATIRDVRVVELEANARSEALLFDLP